MTILHISDTHNYHILLQDLPVADMIVHSGDVSMAGKEDEVIDFVQWFLSLPYKYKIFIAGNHDCCLFKTEISGIDDNCYYLNNSGVTIEGLRFFGIPMFVEDVIGDTYTQTIENIPINTDVLITHQPPYNIMDKSGQTHFGSVALQDMVKQIKPKVHLFGHIHDSYGMCKIEETIYSNASLVDENYILSNKPNIIEM